MTLEDFKNLKNGDTVTFAGGFSTFYGLKEGDTLTRKTHWLDDDHSVMFSYGPNTDDDYHFFTIEDIKE